MPSFLQEALSGAQGLAVRFGRWAVAPGKIKIIAPIAVLSLSFLVAGIFAATAPDLAPALPQERVWTVSATQVEIQDIQPDLRLFGEVVAGREIELRALVSGEVLEAGKGFKEGGVVNKGEMLLKVDPFDYEAALVEAHSSLAEAEAKHVESRARSKQAVDELRRARKLHERGTISIKTLEDKQVTVEIEGARLKQQEASLARAKVGIERAERNLENTQVVAPFNAVISQVSAAQGRRLGNNDRVANLIDVDRLEVRLALSDAQYGRILTSEGTVIGRKVRVMWRVGEKVLSYDAVIDRVGAEISAASGGVDVYGRLIVEGLVTPIRPGAFVEVLVPDRLYQGVVRLPQSAVFNDNTIYAIVDGRLHPRDITVEAVNGSEVLVKGNVVDGDSILITRFAEVGKSVKVEVP